MATLLKPSAMVSVPSVLTTDLIMSAASDIWQISTATEFADRILSGALQTASAPSVFNGSGSFSGVVSAGGTHDTGEELTVATADALGFSTVALFRNTNTVGNIGGFAGFAKDSADVTRTYSRVLSSIVTNTAGAQVGGMSIQTLQGSTALADALVFSGANATFSGEVLIEASAPRSIISSTIDSATQFKLEADRLGDGDNIGLIDGRVKTGAINVTRIAFELENVSSQLGAITFSTRDAVGIQEALRLDSNQDATFSGDVIATGATVKIGVEGNSAPFLEVNDTGQSFPYQLIALGTRFSIRRNAIDFLNFEGSTGNATFAQDIAGTINIDLGTGALIGTQLRAFRVLGNVGGVARQSELGVRLHGGITNACGYLRLSTEDGANQLFWTDNAGNFRLSQSTSNVGTTGGVVVGTQTSDERVKKIAKSLFSYGLNEVVALADKAIEFTFSYDKESQKHLGFSAQEVQKLIPEAVYNTKDSKTVDGVEHEDILAMDSKELIPVLFKAIAELNKKIENK